MSRYALGLAIAALSAGGLACGGTYYEHDGLVTTGPPAVTYADPPPVGTSVQADAEGGATTYTSDEVQIGTSSDYEDTDPSALTEFRTTLDPYGTWVDDGTYGTVWVPSATVVGADFSPYVTAGHWVYDDEYIWVSDYDWGWAPFHYGRWVWIGGRGWGWIPGRRYAGAWVSWRVGYDGWGYVGWGPLAPSWYWRGGYAVGIGFAPMTPWVYCSHGDLFDHHVGGHLVASAQVGAVAAHTRPYVPARPSVAGGGSVGGHNVANPSVSGPPPGQLGINNPPRMPAGNTGLMKAQGYAHPSTAISSFGARPPQMALPSHALSSSSSLAPVVRGPTALGQTGYSRPTQLEHGNEAYTTRPQFPSYGSPSYGNGNSAPSFRPAPQPNGSASFRPTPLPNGGASFRSAPSFSAPQYSQPQYGASNSYRAPSFSGGNSYSPPPSAYRAPAVGGGGNFAPAPAYRAPSVGGGGGGGFSAPSHFSSPSRSTSVHVGGGGGHRR